VAEPLGGGDPFDVRSGLEAGLVEVEVPQAFEQVAGEQFVDDLVGIGPIDMWRVEHPIGNLDRALIDGNRLESGGRMFCCRHGSRIMGR